MGWFSNSRSTDSGSHGQGGRTPCGDKRSTTFGTPKEGPRTYTETDGRSFGSTYVRMPGGLHAETFADD